MAVRGTSYLAGAGALALISWPLVMLAQGIPEAEGGARLTAGLDLRLEVDDGDPEFRTGFDLDLITATRTQQLSFSGDFGLTVPLDDVDTATFTDPSYGVGYLRDTGRSRFAFSAEYSETDIERLRQLDDDPGSPFDESLLTLTEDGSQERRQVQASLELGLNDPVGGELRYSYDETLYTDVTDPDLEDTLLHQIGAGLRLDVDPTLSFSLDGEYQWTQVDGLTPETEDRSRLGLGATWQLRPELQLTGSLAYVRLVTDTTVLGVTTRAEQEGVNLSFGAMLDRPNGGYRFSLDRTLNEPGFVTTVALGRNFSLPRGAMIDARIGMTDLPDGNTYAIGGASYSRENGRGGTLNLSLDRSAVINDDDEAVLRTTTRANYVGVLSDISTWSLAGTVIDSDFTDPMTSDIQATELSLRYNRELTEDWELSTGVRYRETRQAGSDPSERSTLFFSLQRTFEIRR